MYLPMHERLGLVAETLRVPQACLNPLNERAKAIINIVQDQSRPIHRRAELAAWYILYNYYRSEVGKISAVMYLQSLPGLETTRAGRGADFRGILRVGRYFIDHITDRYFARRVLQVGHELKHIDQWRAGMTGSVSKDEREFLAFYWEATTPEKSGTGCISHSTRVALIDAALGYLNCLGANKHQEYRQHRQELLRLRQTHQAASGRQATPAPTSCTR